MNQNCPFTFDCSEGAVYSTFQLNWPWGKLRIQSRMSAIKLLLCLNMIRPLLYPEVNTAETIQKSFLTSQQAMNPRGYFTSHRGKFISQAIDLTSLLNTVVIYFCWRPATINNIRLPPGGNLVPLKDYTGFKGTVISSFTHPSVIPNLVHEKWVFLKKKK